MASFITSCEMGDANDENLIEDVEKMEAVNFQRTISSFQNYKKYNFQKLYKSTRYISNLPAHQQKLLRGYRVRLYKVRCSIERNYEIIQNILQDVTHAFENKDCIEIGSRTVEVSECEADKVESVLKQIHREWSAEGEPERNASFKPILDEILQLYPDNRNNVHVLIPGAGLGRLLYELAKRGFATTGNELSLHIVFAAYFILNKCREANMYRVYPWATVTCNHLTSNDQVRSVTFPDVNPSDVGNTEFSMTAGNFTESCSTPNCWDCVATCFFLDTANNVIDYIETIWNILKPGGFWINVGPLLYHHADLPNQESIEPSYEEIRHIIEQIGFVYLKEQTDLSTPYCQNPNSMLNYEYKSVFFVCQKPM